MAFTTENICGLLVRSRLMKPEEMRAMHQRWLAEAGANAANVSKFITWLPAQKYVTYYQAKLLAKGHGETEAYFLNQYKILDRVGRGRMAGVYKATHLLGQTVAIKVLPPSRAKNPTILARFQREARMALRLKHPNVVRSFQIGQAGALHYLVMEYLEGETLEDVLTRRRRLPPTEAVRLIHQALAGLQHIHELGLVHRDLKPANLMLVPARAKGEPDTTLRATVKILDIGLGRELFDESAPTRQEQLELTGEGVILGTPDYLAPEQARDSRAIDIRADIYSLGCVLYHLLAGQSPFPDKNLISQMVRHASETPKPLHDFNPEIPDGLQQIVGFMIAKQPSERYPTPERAAQALDMFLVADSQLPDSAEDTPQLRNYLTWVEAPSEPRSGARLGIPVASAALPVATPMADVDLALPEAEKPKKQPPSGHGKIPVAKPAPTAGAQEFDVELVTMPDARPAAAPAPRTALGLTSGQWLMLAVGAVGFALAVLGGIVIAILLGLGS